MTQTPQELYPEQYYATFDVPAQFWDAWDVSDINVIPAPEKLFPMTLDQWNEKGGSSGPQKLKVVSGSTLIDYTPPIQLVPLETQAKSALTTARTYVNDNYTMLNEATPDAWVAYLKALMAIANGTDTTSTALPAAPT
ncbi:hypothetical protein [Acetobacter malorum]|uniref:hypothetical protein n=1 Tax=Acetobacter malorum TaxID=178901 RepID=UPI0039E9C695